MEVEGGGYHIGRTWWKQSLYMYTLLLRPEFSVPIGPDVALRPFTSLRRDHSFSLAEANADAWLCEKVLPAKPVSMVTQISDFPFSLTLSIFS